MIKSSSLYLVIIIALLIGIICSSLIAVAYFYKAESLKKNRYDKLSTNMSSGINILLGSPDSLYLSEQKIDLFENTSDSISIYRYPWGIYDIGIVKAYQLRDTLYKIFSIANKVDSAKWGAIYVADQDRPLAVGGKTFITGTAYLPKSGVQSAYVENIAYSGYKELVKGRKSTSSKEMDTLNDRRVKLLDMYRTNMAKLGGQTLKENDSVNVSFRSPSLYIKLQKNHAALKNIKLFGNIVLCSDSIITVDSTVKFNNILIFAKSVVIGDGFKGTCQIFATDSISIGKKCILSYPSVLGTVNTLKAVVANIPLIHIGQNTNVSGQVFNFQRNDDTKTDPLIKIDKFSKITGQIYTKGTLLFGGTDTVNGNIYTKNLAYKNLFFAYYSYLYNVTIDETGLSPYYLTSTLFPLTGKKKKVLQWLEEN